MSSSTIALITRPGAAGRHWTEALLQADVVQPDVVQPQISAEWWPAFEIDLTPDAAARAALAQLSSYDCVVLVSPAAVTSVAQILQGVSWPQNVAIAAVGTATAQAARSALRLSDATPIIVPPHSAADSGSEALWPALQAHAPRRVLIARAQHGRDWLAQQLTAQGAVVNTAAVYSRIALPLTSTQCAQVLRWRDEGMRLVPVFTSSEAVEVVLEDRRCDEQTRAAVAVLRNSATVATHARIGERLRQCGANQVQVLPHSSSALIHYLRSLKPTAK